MRYSNNLEIKLGSNVYTLLWLTRDAKSVHEVADFGDGTSDAMAHFADFYNKQPYASLLQDPTYGDVIATYYKGARHIAALTCGGKIIGMAQFIVMREGTFWEAVRLEGGPVLSSAYNNEEAFNAFCILWARLWPRRLGRVRRFLPMIYAKSGAYSLEAVRDSEGVYKEERDNVWGMDNCDQAQEILVGAGWKPMVAPYQTIRLSVDDDWNLRKNWRNSYHNAIRASLRIQWDDGGSQLLYFRRMENIQAKKKAYRTMSENLWQLLMQKFASVGQVHIARVYDGDILCAGALFIRHGQTATYQVAFTTKEGRAKGAQNFLLMEAQKKMRSLHAKSIDLGGVNDVSAQGVKYFKEGLGGQNIWCAGIYR
jgi:hypothetical protein